ncbi:910_t:CDS:2, partial [Funneliformis geosporum]
WSVVNIKLLKLPSTPPTISRPALHLHNLKVVFKEYSDLQAVNVLDAPLKNGIIGMTAAWYQGWLEWFGLNQNQNDYYYIIDTHTALTVSDHFSTLQPTRACLITFFLEGSSRSDFTAVKNSRQLQFPFFIVDFEQQGFEVHKDFAVVYEAVFELNRILSRTQDLSPDEIMQIKIHVGLINDASINLDVEFYNVQTGHQHDDVKNILDLVVYLRQVVCSEG